MAASRLLGAAAACVILLSFAAESRKSYWGGCIQAAIVIWQQIFLTLADKDNRPGWRTAHASSFVVVLGSDS